MAKAIATAADRAATGQTTPHDDTTVSAACLIPTRHGRCAGQVVSLAYVGPCTCPCHRVGVAA